MILIAITLIAAIAIAGFVFGLFGSFTSSSPGFFGQVVEDKGNVVWVNLVRVVPGSNANTICRQDFPLFNSGLHNGTLVFFRADPNWIDYHAFTVVGTDYSATQAANQYGSKCLGP